MAHRDLTQRFRERRHGIKQHQLRFRLRRLASHPPPVFALFHSKQQLKSRAMEKALLQEALECDRIDLGDSVHKPEWTHFADDANEAIRLLHVKLEYLELIHTRRLMIRFDDAEAQHEREIDDVTSEITTLFQRADRSLKTVTSPFVGGVPSVSATDRVVRVNTQRSIARRLETIAHRFRRRQREYLDRLQVQKFGADLLDVDALECGSYDDHDDKLDLAHELLTCQSKARDDEVQRIATSVTALASVFHAVAAMVIDQGTLVVGNMRSGFEALRRAETRERSTRPERCILVLVALIFGCFGLLVLKHA